MESGNTMMFSEPLMTAAPTARILVVDDEYVIRDLLSRVLGVQGYEVMTASDGIEGLERLREYPADLMVMDLKMPRMAGMELLEKARQLRSDMLIVVITGHGTIETAKEAMKQGCVDFITKPFDVDELTLIVKRSFEMKQLISDKQKLQEQLELAQRLASLAEMGATIVHEVNTVLTSVKLYLEMFNSYVLTAEEDRRNRLILQEVERAEKMIRRFLDFVRPAHLDPVRTDIHKIITRCLQFLQYRFDRQGVTVIPELAGDPFYVMCDPGQMEEVFLNIFSNCIDAMPEGGTLGVRSEGSPHGVRITVTDTGTGIPLENVSRVYTPFFTTKPRGAGLGLSIVHRILDEHKGRISIRNREGRGTVTDIELPLGGENEKS